jgi:phage internal scaffolding protein
MRKALVQNTEGAFVVVGEPPRVLFPWERIDVVTPVDGPSMTKQAFQAECDINNIMKRYEKTGIIDHLNKYGGRFGDFTGAVDFQTAQNIVIDAQKMFMDIPASIRAQFENDPGKFIQFATDPANLDKLREMGLAPPAPVPVPDTPVIPDKPVEPDKK